MNSVVFFAVILSLVGAIILVWGAVVRPLTRTKYVGGALLFLGVVAAGIMSSDLASRLQIGTLTDTNHTPVPAFAVLAVLPQFQEEVPKNAVVRVVFSKPLPESAALSLRVARLIDGQPEPFGGSIAVHNDMNVGSITYQPTCADAKKGCFTPGTYRLELDEKLKDDSGVYELTCNDEYRCTYEFTVGDFEDTAPPKVTLEKTAIVPATVETTVPIEVSEPVYARLTLNQGQVSETFVGGAFLSGGTSVLTLNTSAIANNTTHLLTVDVVDAAGRSAQATTALTVFKAHCVNTVQDEDEFGLDCGGRDCRACTSE